LRRVICSFLAAEAAVANVGGPVAKLGAVCPPVKRLVAIWWHASLSTPTVCRSAAPVVGLTAELGVIRKDDTPPQGACWLAPIPGTILGMSGSAWGIVWLAIALKIPIVALLWIVWWAIKDPPVPEPHDDGGGSPDRDPHRHPRGRPPHPPRRGPHGEPEPSAPRRVRVAERRPRVPSDHRD